MNRGGSADISLRKVEATENWPSRSRCIAIARLINEGREARASYLVVGKGVALNFWRFIVLAGNTGSGTHPEVGVPYFIEDLLVFREARMDVLKVIVYLIKGLFYGVLELRECD